jgi:hypothetical protein
MLSLKYFISESEISLGLEEWKAKENPALKERCLIGDNTKHSEKKGFNWFCSNVNFLWSRKSLITFVESKSNEKSLSAVILKGKYFIPIWLCRKRFLVILML